MSPEPVSPDAPEVKLAAPAPLSRNKGTWRRSAWWPLLAIILPLGLVDFGIASLMDYIPQSSPFAVIVYGCLGLMAAQALLLTVGLVFGCEAIGWRLLVHWACLIGLVAVWQIGIIVDNPNFSMKAENSLRLFCSLPAISLALQLPLWTARGLLGWRFERRSLVSSPETASPRPKSQHSVRDLFLATAVVAVTLGISRWAPQPDSSGAMQINYWVVLGLFGAGAAGVCLVGLIPLLGLFCPKSSLGLSLALSAGYSVLVMAVSSLMMPALGLRLNSGEFQGLLAVIASLFAGLVAGLMLLRLFGIGVQRGHG